MERPLIAGLSWSVWLLLAAAVGVGLTLELVFFFGYRRRGGTTGPGTDPSPGDAGR